MRASWMGVLVLVSTALATPAQAQKLDSLIRHRATVRVQLHDLEPGWHLGRLVMTSVVGGGEATLCPAVAPQNDIGLLSVDLELVDSLEVWVADTPPDLDATDGWRPIAKQTLEQASRHCRQEGH